jgi:hypothetical protein
MLVQLFRQADMPSSFGAKKVALPGVFSIFGVIF